MPRKARNKSSTGIYHVMMSGINHQVIFEDDDDNQYFISCLERMCFINGDDGTPLVQSCTYYAYCLMPNHFHLLIREREEKIDQTLKRIADAYVYYYNRKYQRSGHLFKERFRSEPVDNMNYFTTLLCYIHQNPVKAGIVDNVADYAYSSWREYSGEIFSQARICHVEAVLRKIPFEELKELVYTPLPENVGIIDIDDEPLRHRLGGDVQVGAHIRPGAAFQEEPGRLLRREGHAQHVFDQHGHRQGPAAVVGQVPEAILRRGKRHGFVVQLAVERGDSGHKNTFL